MIHVVLDTTVFRSDPSRKRAAFRTLSALAEAGEVCIHIPELVMWEFLSWQAQNAEKQLKRVNDSIRSARHLALDSSLLGQLAQAMISIPSSSSLWNDFNHLFWIWIKRTNSTVHRVADSHGRKVVDAYFHGGQPFREPKKRDDFPDAFIWQTVVDLTKDHKELRLVSGDGGLQKAGHEHSEITTYDKLDDFVTNDCRELLTPTAFAVMNLDRIRKLLPSHSKRIFDEVEESVIDTLCDGMSWVEEESIPEADGSAEIMSARGFENCTLDAENAKWYGNGLFEVPFCVETEALLDYSIYEPGYDGMRGDRRVSLSRSHWNPDCYLDAEETCQIRAEGLLSFLVDDERISGSDVKDSEIDELLGVAKVQLERFVEIEAIGLGG